MEKKERKKKSPALTLRVTINEKCVQEKNSTETFLTCIRMLGGEKIAPLQDIRANGFPLVVSSKDGRLQMKPLDNKWFVCTHMSTKGKKYILEQIAKRLGVNLRIELI